MIFYLTKTERALYDKLPKSLKAEWAGEVQDEKKTSKETLPMLEKRYAKLLKAKEPSVVALDKFLKKGVSFQSLPHALLHTFFTLIGYPGMTGIINGILVCAENIDDLETAAALSIARHGYLVTNISQ